FMTPTYNKWCAAIKERPRRHRKQWEFVYILQVLENAGLLREGSRGIGFGVGVEPLPAVFANFGCDIVATDLGVEDAKGLGWISTNQHARELSQLNDRGICPPEKFKKHVKFEPADMNQISEHLTDESYDFTWSACSLEHLGTLKKGLNFVKNSLRCLKPGGIAVHTTEYNVGSNSDTLTEGGTVIYRQKDIENFISEIRHIGHEMTFNSATGSHTLDKYFDVPPYREDFHLRLLIDPYITTSVGLVIKKTEA
ncbi:MAG: methyltransferase domain-containing protein, partial [Bacteroidota bacterium]